MKPLKNIGLIALLILGIMGGKPLGLKACDRSSFALDSIKFDGTNYVIYSKLCVGGGVLGFDQGANQNTSYITFSFYGGVGLNVITAPDSIVPDSVISGSTATIYNDPLKNPQTGQCCPPCYFGSAKCDVTYGPTGFTWFTCITSTASCARPHAVCRQLVFTVNMIPDSINANGVEGGGIVTAGCKPSADTMKINFVGLPIVLGSFTGYQDQGGVLLNWSSYDDREKDKFLIQRSADGKTYKTLGSVWATGIGLDDVIAYKYFDPSPAPGPNKYRVVLVSSDGHQTETEAITVLYNPPANLTLNYLKPVPAIDRIYVSFSAPKEQKTTVLLLSLKGEVLENVELNSVPGFNEISFDLSEYKSGVYFVQVRSGSSTLTAKALKL